MSTRTGVRALVMVTLCYGALEIVGLLLLLLLLICAKITFRKCTKLTVCALTTVNRADDSSYSCESKTKTVLHWVNIKYEYETLIAAVLPNVTRLTSYINKKLMLKQTSLMWQYSTAIITNQRSTSTACKKQHHCC